jgi:hypothetical protein
MYSRIRLKHAGVQMRALRRGFSEKGNRGDARNQRRKKKGTTGARRIQNNLKKRESQMNSRIRLKPAGVQMRALRRGFSEEPEEEDRERRRGRGDFKII